MSIDLILNNDGSPNSVTFDRLDIKSYSNLPIILFILKKFIYNSPFEKLPLIPGFPKVPSPKE